MEQYLIYFGIIIVGYWVVKAIKNNEVQKKESIELAKNNLVQEYIDFEKLVKEEYSNRTDSDVKKKITEIFKNLPDSKDKSIFEKYTRIIKDLPEMKVKYIRLRERYRLDSIENRIKTVQVWQHYLSQIGMIEFHLYAYSSFGKDKFDIQELNTFSEFFVALDETEKIFEEMLKKDL